MSEEAPTARSRDLKVGALLALALVVVFGGLYVAGYMFTSDRVPRGASVAGVRIGGLAPEAAEQKLREELGPRARRPIPVVADGRRASIQPRRAGLRLDVEQTLEQAGGGRSWNPARMWEYLVGGENHDPLVSIDREKLTGALEPIASKVDSAPTDGDVVFAEGRPEATYSSPGQAIDTDGAADAVTDAFAAGLASAEVDEVQLPVREVAPEVTDDEVRSALQEFANPAMSEPVVVELGKDSVALPPSAYAGALSMTAQDGELAPVLDEKALVRGIGPALQEATTAPKDAEIRLVDGRPQVIPARAGVSFQRAGIAEKFRAVLTREGQARRFRVEVVKAQPQFTTADARELGIKRVVSRFTTNYPHAEYRNVNLGRAAELVNGTVLMPGETFSLNRTVGERTRKNGFVEGFVISDGVYQEELGGGVSQVATTLFNAAFFAGLEDVEHTPHSFYIDRYPVGREATVAWGLLDLRFKNDTPYGVLIQAGIRRSTPAREGAMTVKMWSTKHWDITAGRSEFYDYTEEQTRVIDDANCTPNDGYSGFEVDVYRYFRKPGSDDLVRKETMHTTYTPSDTVICR